MYPARAPSFRLIGGLLVVLLGAGLVLSMGKYVAPALDDETHAALVPGNGLPPPAVGLVQGRVHDIFGDPLSYPQVRFGAHATTGDAAGAYTLGPLPVGAYDVSIAAPNFQSRTFRYTVYEGQNAPRIKYDTGLWPTAFAIDFHVFYDPNRPERHYALVGLANPTGEPVYVTAMTLATQSGAVIQDVLQTYDDFQRFILIYAGVTLALDPAPAIVVPARGVIGQIELQPFPAPGGDPADHFTLTVAYAGRAGYRDGAQTKAVRRAIAGPEEDLNPHAP